MLARGLTDISMATRIDQLIQSGCPPFIAVLPDTMTRLGGSQYVNSPAIGNYATYVAEEVLAAAASQIQMNGKWGVIGHSSGGFGALHLSLEYPGLFQAAACHAGDMGFDLMFLSEIAHAVSGVQRAGGIDHFLEYFWNQSRPGKEVFAAFNLIAMACAYSPNPEATGSFPADFPVDFETGEVDFEILTSWRSFDPVTRLRTEKAQTALRALGLLFLDVGRRDEYNLHLGARRLVSLLRESDVPFVYEEFDGGHRGTSYRFDRSLPMISRFLHGLEDS